jgi:hypothetical protein
LNLNYDEPLPNFAFNFNSRHYILGSEGNALRKRSVALLTGVRSLAARLLRLSAAVGHTVGAAALADAPAAGPLETGIAELVVGTDEYE